MMPRCPVCGHDHDRWLCDLFCGAGGAAWGYHQAGFGIVGVDNRPQPRYPFTFVRGDALAPPVRLNDFFMIHASPPCQGYSRLRHLPWLRDRSYPRLIEAVREILEELGGPWIIENVEDAPLAKAPGLFGRHGVTLCGTMFDLPGQYRHRRFESNVQLAQPYHPRHTFVMAPGNASLADRYPGRFAGVGGGDGDLSNKERAEGSMGIDWMSAAELRQAIPPVFTRFLGSQVQETFDSLPRLRP